MPRHNALNDAMNTQHLMNLCQTNDQQSGGSGHYTGQSVAQCQQPPSLAATLLVATVVATIAAIATVVTAMECGTPDRHAAY